MRLSASLMCHAWNVKLPSPLSFGDDLSRPAHSSLAFARVTSTPSSVWWNQIPTRRLYQLLSWSDTTGSPPDESVGMAWKSVNEVPASTANRSYAGVHPVRVLAVVFVYVYALLPRYTVPLLAHPVVLSTVMVVSS